MNMYVSLHLPLPDIENGFTVMPMLLNPSVLSVSCLFLRTGRPCATCAVATLVIETKGLRLPWPKTINYKNYSIQYTRLILIFNHFLTF